MAQWGGPGTPASRSQGTAPVRMPPLCKLMACAIVVHSLFFTSVIPPRFCTHRFVVLFIGISFLGYSTGLGGEPISSPCFPPDAGVPPLRQHRHPRGGGRCCLGLSQVTFRQFGVLRMITCHQKGACTKERGGGGRCRAALDLPGKLAGEGRPMGNPKSPTRRKGRPQIPPILSKGTPISPFRC